MKRWILVGVIGVLAALSLDPALLGLSTVAPFTQAIAMRGLVVLGFLGLAVAVLIVAGVTGLATHRAPARLLATSAIFALVGAAHGGVLAVRGLSTDTLADSAQGVTVFTLNTLGGATQARDIAVFLAEQRPDVVALQEAPAEFVAQVVAEAASAESAAALPAYQVFTDGEDGVAATALLVSTDLGEYTQVEGPDTTFGAVRAEPVDGDGPVLVSVHPVPPARSNMGPWRSELETVTALCESVPNLVMAGDFNATFDHAPLRRCTDAAEGVGGVGTWPTQWPALLGAPIDHVVVGDGDWRGTGARVVELAGSDHRGVLVSVIR